MALAFSVNMKDASLPKKLRRLGVLGLRSSSCNMSRISGLKRSSPSPSCIPLCNWAPATRGRGTEDNEAHSETMLKIVTATIRACMLANSACLQRMAVSEKHTEDLAVVGDA